MSFEYFDAHSHLHFEAYDADRDAVIERMEKAGVGTITVGVDYESSCKAVACAEANEGVYACVGLHPADNASEEFEQARYENLLLHPKVVALGECGLDYFHTQGDRVEDMRRQRRNFILQIETALHFDKALMLHCRDAYGDVLDILSSYAKNYGEKVRGNVHFFAGTVAEARAFLELGFTLSFTGVVTFARDYDEVVKYVPRDCLLAETDAPFVAPVPYRGKRNEPSFVGEVVNSLAAIREDDTEILKKALISNVFRVFNLHS